jgi:hypothetical protein
MIASVVSQRALAGLMLGGIAFVLIGAAVVLVVDLVSKLRRRRVWRSRRT